MATHKVVSDQDWLAAHSAHLQEEKQLTRQRDALSAMRSAKSVGNCPGDALRRTIDFTMPAARYA